MASKLLISFGAGLVGFLSPCVLPLLPGYVGYMTGAAVGEKVPWRKALPGTLAFVGGLAFVFVSLGASASIISVFLNDHKRVIERVSGSFIIALGLAMAMGMRLPFLMRERRFHMRPGGGPVRTFLLGAAFAFGWTPCIGPVLAGILTAAAGTQTAWTGAGLLFVYSLGLGVPFMLLAVGYERAGRAFGWLRRHGRAIERVGGALLILMGILMITGQWTRMFIPLIRWFSENRWPPI